MRLRSRPTDVFENWRHYMAARAENTDTPALQRFYSAGLPTAETAIGEAPLLALDIETTGLDPQRDAIVSIGMVPFNTRRIHLSERRYWIVHPECALNSRSVTLHHITHADIEQAPPFSTILPELLDAMSGYLPVVHYRTIERSFLNHAVNAAVGEAFAFPSIDTMEIEARQHRPSLWKRWRHRIVGSPVSIRLHDSRARYHLPYYQGHHALVDALATAELLQAQVAALFSPDTPVHRFCG